MGQRDDDRPLDDLRSGQASMIELTIADLRLLIESPIPNRQSLNRGPLFPAPAVARVLRRILRSQDATHPAMVRGTAPDRVNRRGIGWT